MNRFEQITIVDADLTSMQTAVAKLPLGLQAKIKPVELELTGILSLLMREIIKMPRNSDNQSILKLWERILVHTDDITSLGQFDFVVSTMLTSQLYAFVEKITAGFFSNFPHKSPIERETIFRVQEAIALRHIDLLHRSCLPEGKVYYADSFKLYETRIEGDKTNRTFRMDVFPIAKVVSHIKSLFEQEQAPAQWVWQTRPAELLFGTELEVMAYFLKRKSQGHKDPDLK